MTSIGYASLQIIPSLRGMDAAINRQLDGVMPAAGRRAGEQLGDGASSGFNDRIGGMTKYAKAAAIGVSVALGAGAIGIAKWGIGLAAANEQAQISFETMLGSAEKARTFLDDLRDFAAATPFEFPELQTAASSLISAGVGASKVIPIMTTLGDVTAGMGTGSEGIKRATVALQQMQAAGKITGEDLNQLRDAGIPVYDLLAAATGRAKTEVTALAQAGKLGKADLDALMKALETGKGLERFSGLMEKQSQSLSGLFSSFKDNLGQGLATAMEPAVVKLKEMLPAAQALTEKGLVVLGDGFTAALDAGTSFAEWVAPMARDVGDHLVPVLENLAEIARNAVPDALKLVGGALVIVYRALLPVIDATEALTGFLADHEEVVIAVAAAYAAWKLTGIGSDLAGNVVSGVTKATASLRDMRTAIQNIAATRGVSEASATLGVLRSTLTAPVSGGAAATAGLAGLAIGATVAIKSLERSAENGRQAARDFIDTLNVNPSSTNSMVRALNDAQKQMDAIAEKGKGGRWERFTQRINPWSPNDIDEAQAESDELKKYMDGLTKIADRRLEVAQMLGIPVTVSDKWITKLNLDVEALGPKRLAAAIEDAQMAAGNGTPATDKLRESYKAMSDETANSTDRMNAWKDALDVALGQPRNLFDAETAFKQSLGEFEDTLAANRWGGFKIDSEWGRNNREALSGMVGNVQDLANAYADLGQQDKAAETIRYGREQIVKAGEAAGISKEQTEAYLDQLGLTEGTWKAQVELSGADAAQKKLDAIQASLKLLDGSLSMAEIKVQVGIIQQGTAAGSTTTVGPIVIPGTMAAPDSGRGPGGLKITPIVPPDDARTGSTGNVRSGRRRTAGDVTVIAQGASSRAVADELLWATG